MTDHYFFRFGSKNAWYKEAYELIDQQDVRKGIRWIKKDKKPFELAIYYNNKFKAKNTNEKLFLTRIEMGPIGISQVLEFSKAKKNSVFWIFEDDYIIAFSLLDNDIFDSSEASLISKCDAKILPKSRKCKFLAAVPRFEMPELFSTLDTSGFRGTIMLLDPGGPKKENIDIGMAILDKKKTIIISSVEEALRYLSPIQLETAIFKIFNDNKYFVSSHRGGSRKKIDLRILGSVELAKKIPIPCFNTSKDVLIQVKRNSDLTPKEIHQKFLSKEIYFVTLDKNTTPPIFSSHQQFYLDSGKISAVINSKVGKSTKGWIKNVLGEIYFSLNF